MTVACCNRNGSATLQDAISSAQAQSFGDIEILLIDDASTDDSLTMMQRLADQDPRVRIIRHESQRGLAGGQNTALAAARADLLAFIDADDLWRRDKIRLQLEAMADDVALVGCYSAVIDSNAGLTGWRVGRAFSHEPGAQLVGDPVSGGSVALLRVEAVRDAGGFDEHLRCRPDWDMWLRLARHHRMCSVAEVLVGYRRAVGNLSTDYSRMVEEGRYILDKASAADPALTGDALIAAMANDLAGIAGLAVLDRRYDEARELYRRASQVSWRGSMSASRLYARAALAMRSPGQRLLLEGVTGRRSRRRVGAKAGSPFS